MAGGSEDSQAHHDASNPTSSPAPKPSPAQNGPKTPGIQTTGEIMIGFALAIIFIVIFSVIIHLLLKHRRQNGPRRKKNKKTKKKDIESRGTIELHSVDKKIFEAGGTQVVLCELPSEAPPRQEMEAGLSGFIFPFSPISPLERAYTGTTTSSFQFNLDEISPQTPLPSGHQFAAYWAAR